jgi:hypothetical protein
MTAPKLNSENHTNEIVGGKDNENCSLSKQLEDTEICGWEHYMQNSSSS